MFGIHAMHLTIFYTKCMDVAAANPAHGTSIIHFIARCFLFGFWLWFGLVVRKRRTLFRLIVHLSVLFTICHCFHLRDGFLSLLNGNTLFYWGVEPCQPDAILETLSKNIAWVHVDTCYAKRILVYRRSWKCLTFSCRKWTVINYQRFRSPFNRSFFCVFFLF